MKKLITAAGLLLALAAGAQQVMQIRNPLDKAECATVIGAGLEWRACTDGNQAQQLPVSIVTPSTPTPTPTPTEPPKTTPAEVKSAVPITSTIKGPPGSYPATYINGMVCLNNNWGATGPLVGGTQGFGARAASNGGVDMRTVVNFPGLSRAELANRSEVSSYPSCIKGKTPSGSPASPDKSLPKRVGDLQEAWFSHTSADGSLSDGQRTADIWITDTMGCDRKSCRHIELMVVSESYNGYNMPYPGGPASAGRTKENLGRGPNPRAEISRVNFDGVVADVFAYYPPTTDDSRMVKVIPVSLPGKAGGRVNVKAILDWMVGKGYMTNNHVLGAIEVGWEPVVEIGPARGDATVSGLRIEVR